MNSADLRRLGAEAFQAWRETLSKATGVCREAAYLRTRFERDGRGMTRASFGRKSRPRLRRENFPLRASCVRFHHQPPKAAEFISPARQRWEKIVFGREAPEGRHPIKSAFVADPPASSGSVTPTIAFTLTRAVFQRCLEPRPRTSARRPCAVHPLRRVLQIEIANQPVQIIRMHAQTLRGLRATAFRFFQSTLNQALL